MRPDPVGLLLTEACESEAAHARALVTCLRLLAGAASAPRAERVGLGLDRARAVLDRELGVHLTELLEDLTRRYLTAALGPDGFGWFGEPRFGLQVAWSALEERRGELPGLPGVPAPDESALEVATRLVEDLGRLCGPGAAGLAAQRLALWRARLTWVREGAEAGEQAFARLARAEPRPTRAGAAAADVGAGALRHAVTVGRAECQLELGQPRAAAAWLAERRGPRGDGPPAGPGEVQRAAQLESIALLACGDVEGSRRARDRAGDFHGPVPRALVELREERPEWLDLLAGPERPGADRAERGVGRADAADGAGDGGRDALRARLLAWCRRSGACFAALFELEDEGGARLVAHAGRAEGAARARARADAAVAQWALARRGALRRGGTPEAELVAQGRCAVRHAPDGRLEGAACSPDARALAVEGTVDASGRLRGWLWTEWDHHLVPARAARGAEAAALAGVRRTGRARAAATAGVRSESPRAARCFEELAATLAPKAARRRWWGVRVSGDRLRVVAEGGDGLEDPGGGVDRPPRGGWGCVARARLAGRPAAFREPEASASIHPRAGSGLALPLHAAGRVVGVFALESERRRDLGPTDAERLAERASAGGMDLVRACFADWHERRHGAVVRLPDTGALAELLPVLIAAGRAHGTVVLSGAPGTGREVLARFVAWVSDPRRPLDVLACGTLEPDELAERLFDAPERCTLLLDEVERLPEVLQLRLLRWFDDLDAQRARGPRWILSCTPHLEGASQQGSIRSDLARRLERLELRIPELAQRREEIPALARLFLERFSGREGLRAPRLDDGALAFLWRQPWSGGIRALENFVYKLVLAAPDASLTAADLREHARRFALAPVVRLPSRHPDAALLASALRTTRHRCGSANRTRAAAYLGWDPDTLGARLRDAGLDADALT